MSCLRSRGVVAGASKMARMSAPARVSQSTSSADRGLGWRACPVASAAPARVTAASLSSQAASSERATSRFSGSQASYWRRARPAS